MLLGASPRSSGNWGCPTVCLWLLNRFSGQSCAANFCFCELRLVSHYYCLGQRQAFGSLSFSVLHLFLLVLTPESSSCHDHPSIFSCLVWFQSDLVLIPAATSQNFLMLGLVSSHHLFVLYIELSPPVSETRGFLCMYTLMCLSGDFGF